MQREKNLTVHFYAQCNLLHSRCASAVNIANKVTLSNAEHAYSDRSKVNTDLCKLETAVAHLLMNEMRAADPM